MRILITGAAGFLGRYFTRFHSARGDELVCVDDLSSPHASFLDVGAHNVREDLGFALRQRREVGGGEFDLVYHFASPVGGRMKIELDPMYNADAFRLDSEMMRWAVRTEQPLVVYPSSSAVYPVRLQQHVEASGRLAEHDANAGAKQWWGVPDAVYGASKLVGERLAMEAARYGVNVLCIRPFSGYGVGQSPEYPFPAIMQRAIEQQDPLTVWGSGEQVRDWVHVADVVGATWARIEAGVNGYAAMNICTGEGTSFIEMAKLAARVAGYEPEIVPLPDKPAGVMFRVGDPTEMLRYYQPMVSLVEGIEMYMEQR